MENTEKRTIRGLPLPVSPVFFGTAMEPLMRDGDAAAGLLDSVLEAGVNAFDCARSYGQAEVALGRWIRARGCRDEVAILTKCGDIREGRVEVNRGVIREQMAQSLDRLQTDCIDLYLLHRDDPSVEAGAIIEIMNALYSEGKIRAFGGSNWSYRRIEEANEYAYSHGLIPFSVSSPNFGLAEQVADP